MLCRSLLRRDDRGDAVFFKSLLRSWKLTNLRRLRTPKGPRPPLEHPARVIFQDAATEAQAAGRTEIDTEHIAFAWMRQRRRELLHSVAEFRRTYHAARRQFAEYQRTGGAASDPALKRGLRITPRSDATAG